jgi:glycosyltransferase 2 family protein
MASGRLVSGSAWVQRTVQTRRVRLSLTGVSIAVAIAVPVLTLPGLPRFSVWPALIGLLPWMIGKYVLCPLRWHALSESGRSRLWHLNVYAQSELLGLLTPGHIGSDIWRVRRLSRIGMPRLSAAAEVALDRFVGVVGLLMFVAFAAATLPFREVMIALGIGLLGVLAALVVRYLRPQWMPQRKLPSPRRLAHGLLLSVGYQASIVALLLGTLLATGYSLPPMGVIGAFGASQLAGAIPGPQGASPRDGALVVALTALGIPWLAALGAVTLKALLAWAPALVFGGGCLLLARWRRESEDAGTWGTGALAVPGPGRASLL